MIAFRCPSGFSARGLAGILPSAVALLACACGEAASGADAGVAVRDSVGIEIVENLSYASGQGEGWHLAEVPDVDIGVVEGDPVYQMFRVTGATRLANGGIAVANSGTSEVRIYDPSGRFVGAAGGPGEGPGEFRRLRELWPYHGDSLIAWDYGLRRATVLGPQGDFGRLVRMAAAPTNPGILRPFGDGSLILVDKRYDPSGSGVQQQVMELTLHGPEGALRDSLGAVPLSKTIVVGAGPGMFVGSPGFSARTSLAVADRVIYVGDPSTPEVEVRTPGGEVARKIRWPDENRAVEQHHIDEYKIAELEEADDESTRRQLRTYFEQIPYETVFPAYQRILSDRAGRVWVELYRRAAEEGPRRWMVIDAEGRALGELSLPERLRPLEIGDGYVLGVEHDELDVEHVRLYRVRK